MATGNASASVNRVVRVLDALCAAPGGLRATELASECEIARSTVHVVLNSLAAAGMIEHDPRRGTWFLGIKTLELGMRYLRSNSLESSAADALGALADATRCTAHLAVRDGTDVVYLAKRQPPDAGAVRLVTEVGVRLPAHLTAVGQALLSGMPDGEVRRLYSDDSLADRTGHGPRSVTDLLANLASVRACGFAEERGLTTPGIGCIAAPVYDGSGSPVAAIGITRIDGELADDAHTDLVTRVMDGARSLSRRLGQET